MLLKITEQVIPISNQCGLVKKSDFQKDLRKLKIIQMALLRYCSLELIVPFVANLNGRNTK